MQNSRIKAKDLSATTIRLQPETRNRLANVKINSLVERLLNRWVEDPTILDTEKILEPRSRPTTKQLQQEIANSVARHLQENHDWINEVVLDAQLYREGESIFGERINHFVEEKQFLAERFTAWLLKRVLWYLDQGRRVVLVIDSGTGLYWLFRQFGVQLLARALKSAVLENLVLITNNIPGVDFYITLSRLKPFTPPGKSKEVGLSDYVNCKLLTGSVLAKYAALTGEDTEAALGDQRVRARDAHFIGLVAGQWIRVDNHDPHYPIPLARGRGQAPFKEALIKACDETYLLAPLGKIFTSATIDDINLALATCAEQVGKWTPYSEVSIPDNRRRRIKLVSTSRPSATLLYTHSEVLRKICLPHSVTDYDSLATTAIEEIPAILYPFDRFVGQSTEQQIEKDFAHTYTRKKEFMENHFSVSLDR